jgi:hypothetical protein
MGKRIRRPLSDSTGHDIREQEVRRANKELAAYFKGQRTEREARAALKRIKAYVRYRERLDPASRRTLPAAQSPRATKSRTSKKPAAVEVVARRRSPIAEATSTGEDETAGVASPMPTAKRAAGD